MKITKILIITLLVISNLSLVMAHSGGLDEQVEGMHHMSLFDLGHMSHMGNFGNMGFFYGGLMQLIFFITIIILIYLLIKRLLK